MDDKFAGLLYGGVIGLIIMIIAFVFLLMVYDWTIYPDGHTTGSYNIES